MKEIRYIRCFKFSGETVRNPNLYPYNVLKEQTGELLMFDSITIFYGENGSGKSTLLNLIAAKAKIDGAEPPRPASRKKDYFQEYLKECVMSMEQEEATGKLRTIPSNSRYIKSEDILYEIKKIQQEAILQEGYLYERGRLGMTKEQIQQHNGSKEMNKQMERHLFRQEKYSNGETAMQIFEDYLVPDALYLLDEPEVSLSPDKQLELAVLINHLARLLDVQFIISTHSPLLLGTLEGSIYSMQPEGLITQKWTEFESVRLYADFFEKKRHLFK